MNTRSFFTFLFFFICFTISLSHALNNGLSLSVELLHRDSSKSPLYQPTQTKYQRVANAARRSVNRIHHFYKSPLTKTPESTLIPDKGEYLMTYSVGTPPFKVYGIADTGSDIVWLQCKPCQQCYNQTSPMFDPSKSSSYQKIPCEANTCQYVRDTSCSEQDSCQYTIEYGDRSRSQGDLSVETLTLESTIGHSVSFPKTVIGCGTQNTVSFEGPSSGIVGLGGGPVSLTTQLGSAIGGKFSYCLVPLLVESNTTSKLNFGDAAMVSGDGVVSTPIVKKDPEVFYYLTLEAFTVGNKRVKFGGSLEDGGDEGNIIIDSGTTLTLLPSDIYSNLESAVAELIDLERVQDPNNMFSLCYSVTSSEYDFPIITANFKGADVKLHSISTFVPIADGIVCFAFTSSEIGAIFGNLAQQNLLVGYDLVKNHVSFKHTDCTKL
ncbi:aspartic proteinase CDR1-like [Cicer arietinum]|uniref:Aspartic proteinase CDR1-like n=1 Tax=Cicer arietinum TaxID=3827 RepID=A0A1S2Z1H2_CICAR|nr:aspartic proteinase CDR1-like [Cicer arietinum]